MKHLTILFTLLLILSAQTNAYSFDSSDLKFKCKYGDPDHLNYANAYDKKICLRAIRAILHDKSMDRRTRYQYTWELTDLLCLRSQWRKEACKLEKYYNKKFFRYLKTLPEH